MRGTPACADAIVVAAGASSRMGGVDKLAWSIAGRPLLAYTLAAFAAAPEVEAIVIVASAERRDALVGASWLPSSVRAVVIGGARRQDSVRAGFDELERIEPDAQGQRVTLVHDGARPVVTPALIGAVVAAAAAHGAAIPVLPIVETVKRVVDGQVVETVDRAALASAQTPQGVRRDVFRRALAVDHLATQTWTDEAALLEACRIPVHVVQGDPSNLKVTVPSDLARATDLLTQSSPERRHGIGHDAHPFGPGAPLFLGGVAFVGVPRLAGHSDGDVVLHAIADGLLGAAGLGDLGRMFPAGPATPEGVASADLLSAVVDRITEGGWRPAAVDLTIVGARPRLGPRLEDIRDRVAALLALDVAAVSVKASTGNLDGSEGAGRTISTLALVTIEARS
ncbi:MAG: 2-C-methyl-D-erythritol 4-phosphate cytidylyltransferase [Candidatus Limnocylindrales bacterium]